MSVFSLIFVGRDPCPLCDEAEPIVRRWARWVGASVEVRSVDSDSELSARYGLRIPVVMGPSGRLLAEGKIEERRFVAALVGERIRSLVGSPGRPEAG